MLPLLLYIDLSHESYRKNSGIQSQLVELEERMAIKHTLAIGVLYVKAGQKDENEMFGNPSKPSLPYVRHA